MIGIGYISLLIANITYINGCGETKQAVAEPEAALHKGGMEFN